MSATRRDRPILPLSARFARKRALAERGQSKSKKTFIATMLMIACSSGCDQDKIQANDPAMWNTTANKAAQSTDADVPPSIDTLTKAESTGAKSPKTPKRRYGRVFIPELGWLDEAAFWVMYDNEPEKLPESLDFYAVHQLREEYEREREAEGES